MKDEKTVRSQLKTVKSVYLDRQYQDKLNCHGKNCVHNHQQPITLSNGQPGFLGLCMLNANNPEEWEGKVCDDEQTARECPFYQCKWNKEEIRQEFDDLLENDSVTASEYKDIAALQWVLEERASEITPNLLQRAWLYFMVTLYRMAYVMRGIG